MGRHSDDDGNGIADYAEAHPYLSPDVAVVADPPDPAAVHGVVDDGSVPVPVKVPGEPMRYRRDVRFNDAAAIAAETAHVIAHLSTVAAEDDDPDTNAEDVRISVVPHDSDPDLVSIIGTLDAEPVASYLQPGYDVAGDHDGTTYVRYSEAGRE